ncbi:prenyltransferase/squalene oxidase repeat-containing protein [Verrucomicrobiota bacterium]
MKKTLLITLFLLIAIFPSYSSAKSLGSYKTIYESHAGKIAEKYVADMMDASDKYERTLKAIENKFRNDGELDGLIACKKEIARFGSGKDVPETTPEKTPALIAQAQKIYIKSRSATSREKDQSLAALTKQYCKTLDILLKELVRQDKINEALKVKNEIKRVTALLEEIESSVESVPVVNSPNKRKAPPLFAFRMSERTRADAIQQHGGSAKTEAAVMRALRWLKSQQSPDGFWMPEEKKENCTALTSFALLSFLAHGETPESPEFGDTVDKAINWLTAQATETGRFRNGDSHEYTLPIAAIALCEAYAITKNPETLSVVSKSIELIILGQHANGGWDYNLKQSDRDDTSYMAWCAQALATAKAADLPNKGIKRAMKNAINGFRKNSDPKGGFGYTKSGSNGSSGSGTLGIQVVGGERENETREAVKFLSTLSVNWSEPERSSPLYHWYSINQALFNNSNRMLWTRWNRQMSSELIKSQKILAATGEGEELGYWTNAGKPDHCKDLIYSTALCTLMLESYYRFNSKAW